MTDSNSKTTRDLDRTSASVVVMALLASLILYFLFYAPAIVQGVKSDTLSSEGILWLKIHIASYWTSYILLFAGLLLAIVRLACNAATRFPWIETVTITATALAVVGLITGILFSKAAWNAWWVWDAKQIVVLLNTFLLMGISLLILLTRLYSNPLHRSIALIGSLFIASASCVWSFLIGYLFPRIIHPQWFPYVLFR